MVEELCDDLDDAFGDTIVKYTQFNTIPLSNMEKFDRSDPWQNITFHREHRGKKFKFIEKNNDNVISCKKNKKNERILLKQVFDCKLIDVATLEFTINNNNNNDNNTIGLIEYPLQCGYDNDDDGDDDDDGKELNDIKYVGIYGPLPLQHTRFYQTYYGIETNNFAIWTPNTNTNTNKNTNTRLRNKNLDFSDGDKLIMVLNCNQRECKIYINEINKNYLIAHNKHRYTFNNIPQQFVITYGCQSILSEKRKKKITTEIKLLQLDSLHRLKRKKKKKPKKRKQNLSVKVKSVEDEEEEDEEDEDEEDEDGIDIEYDWASFGQKAEEKTEEKTEERKEELEKRRRKSHHSHSNKLKTHKKEEKRRRKSHHSNSNKLKTGKKEEKRRRKSHHSNSNKLKRRKEKKKRRQSARIAQHQSRKLKKKRRRKKKTKFKRRRNSHRSQSQSQSESESSDEEKEKEKEKEERECVSDFEITFSSKYKIRINEEEEEELEEGEEEAYDEEEEEEEEEDEEEEEMAISINRSKSVPPRRPPPPSPSPSPQTLITRRRSKGSKPNRPSAPPPSQYLKDAYHELDELQIEKEPLNECHLLNKCLSIKRIKILLKFYQQILNQMHHKNHILTTYCRKYHHLLNDYHHILSAHLNASSQENDATFTMLYEMFNIVCDLKSCNAYIRNNRNRGNTQIIGRSRDKDKYLNFYVDLLDTIHIHLLHSFDAGYRSRIVCNDENENENENKDEESYNDQRLKELHSSLGSKYFELCRVRGGGDGVDGIKNNKFVNDFRDKDFGYKFYYWPFYKNNPEFDGFYIESKYANLKEEILSNHIFPLDVGHYDCCIRSAQMHINTIYVRKYIKQETQYSMYATKERICLREGINNKLYYGLSSYNHITIQHLISIVLYCNFSELNVNFRETFKKYLNNLEIHREFANWSKLLRETVEVYGEWISLSKESRFYTQLSSAIMFDPNNGFNHSINMACSSTTQLSLIALYSNCKGFVLEFSENNTSPLGLFVKYFNCSFLSSFSFECERLFIGGFSPLTFKSILYLNNNHNYEIFLNAINIFNNAINGQQVNTLANKPRKIDYIIIDNLIEYELNYKLNKNQNQNQNKRDIPIYPTKIFHFLITKQKHIKINSYNINTSYPKLKKYFISTLPNDDLLMAEMVAFDCITKLCSQCTIISMIMTNSKNIINQSFLSLLSQSIKQLNETNLEIIKFENIRNRCNDKELKKFKSFLNNNKPKWSLNITQMNSDRYKNKFQYSILKKESKGKKTLVNKMKNMFGH